jgi:predicted nucleic acid-binding protein
VSQWIVDASLTLGWYLKDEDDRTYNLDVLADLKTNEALVPFLWTYEVANGPVMAHRRKRLADEDIATIIESLVRQTPTKFMRLPVLCTQAPVNGV